MAQSKKDGSASAPKEQLYFLGKVHTPLSRVQAAQNAKKIVARFEAATPSDDAQVLIWSDVSIDGRSAPKAGGIGIVCDVCLPNTAKYTIEEAEHINTDHGTVVTEAKGVLKWLRRINKEIKAARLESGIRLAITVITDCQSNVIDLARTEPMKAKTPGYYIAVIERIKILSQLLLRPHLNVTLELHWCPRNTTPQLKTAEFLAGHARVMGKHLWEVRCGTEILEGRVRDCRGANTRPRKLFPAKKNYKLQDHSRKLSKHKICEKDVDDSLESGSRQHKR